MTETARPTPNKKLRHERDRRCWSQQELADLLGTTPLNVGRWERGVTLPGPHFRQKLCEVFEKSPYELGLIPEGALTEEAPEVSPEAPAASPPSPTQATPTALWNVPYRRNIFFTGREDILTHLHDALNSEGQPIAITQPQAISGLGGIGKTQTAIEYAYRYRENYTAVLWARADSRDLLISDFLTIATLLNLPERNEQDQNKIINAVKRWFDTHEGWLLILDNADNLEVAEEFIPSAGKGHVLLTTRAHSMGTLAQNIELEKMEVDEGTFFLLRRTKRLKGATSLEGVPASVREQAQAIVEAVDGLPLALDQAGAYIEETGCSFADYLKLYKTRRNRLLRMRGRDASGHPEPVAATWSLSFEKVEQANPAAAELLRLCAFLHPDEIPETMIIKGATELGPILQSIAEDELELNEAIGELHKYSLIRRDPELKMLNIHRLVQAVLKDGMDKETQRKWATRVIRMVNGVFPDPEKIEAWHQCQQYLPHAQLCTELIEQWKLMSTEAASLLVKEGKYLCERGLYSEAVALIQRALILQELMLGKDHYDTAQSLNTLAILYFYQGQYGPSITLIQRVLAIREQVLEANHPDIAQSLNDLGVLYTNQSKYEQAEHFLLRALAIREQIKGPDHPDIGENLYNLGTLYSNWGKHEQAISLLRRALTIVELAFGQTHPNVTHCLRALAMIYKDQGMYEEALSLSQQSLTICEQVFGPIHPNVASSLNNLAILYRKQGMYTQAELLHQRALAIREQVFGHSHPDVANSLNNLGTVYRDQGRYEQAEPLYQRALAIREHILGSDHPDAANSLNNLGLLYGEQKKYEQAELFFQRALFIFEQSLMTEHPNVADTLENYANLLRKTNRETEATALEARAQTIRAKNAK